MAGPDEHPLPRGSGRVLMLGTVVLAAAATAVLALGSQDARLLRLGLIAALWAALLGAFAAARMRREISSQSNRAEELRAVYQLELEREVAARREHMLTVERELREQAEQAQRCEITALRTELAAMRASLEKLMGGDPFVQRVGLRAEAARLLPMAAPTHKLDASSSVDDRSAAAAALGATAKVTGSRTAADLSVRVPGGAVLESQDLPGTLGEQFRADPFPVGSVLPTSEWPVNRHSETALGPGEDPELRFGPGRRYTPELDIPARPWGESTDSGDRPWNPAMSGLNNGSHNNGSHSNGSHNNGSRNNGSHNNGGTRRAAQEAPTVGVQRSVNDLLAAHGASSAPRRRRSREDGPQA